MVQVKLRMGRWSKCVFLNCNFNFCAEARSTLHTVEFLQPERGTAKDIFS